jgi:endonuclease YncB( thermonuclease family)
MSHCKTLSFFWVVLLVFAADNAFSIGVNPKSKSYLRSTLKNSSEEKNKKPSNSGSNNSSGSKIANSSKSRKNSYSAPKDSSILYTLPAAKEFQPATMVKVLDGDTIQVILDGSPFKVSLYGIDTPEKTQSHGVQAAQAVTRLINRKKIQLQVYDKERDGRCSAIVSVGGKNINELLVKGGHAWVNEKYCYEAFCSDWVSYQNKAKSQGKGLWSDSNPKPPWVWRGMPSHLKRGIKQGYSPVANGLRSRYGKFTTIMGR